MCSPGTGGPARYSGTPCIVWSKGLEFPLFPFTQFWPYVFVATLAMIALWILSQGMYFPLSDPQGLPGESGLQGPPGPPGAQVGIDHYTFFKRRQIRPHQNTRRPVIYAVV